MLTDQDARLRATDPHISCIVQAPAGSGKTEILTQRFLRLLGTCEEPEHIVALTFTRKAANEMRERIMRALRQAECEDQPTTPHGLATYTWAKEALAHSEKHGWSLLQTPNRLRITTIDSLCQTLAHAIPLQDKQTPYASINTQPDGLYQTAARNCLDYVIQQSDYQPALRTLLEHLDNRQDRLLALFIEQLRTRDQWLRHLYQTPLEHREHHEQALRLMEHHEILRFKMSIPSSLVEPLIHLSRCIGQLETNTASPRGRLAQWLSLDTLDRHLIQGLSSLLLTSQNTLRKSCDHHVGLKKGVCNEALYQSLKADSKALFDELNDSPGFLDALLRVKDLPEPVYPAAQWDTLQALLTLLPLLAAHLQLVFHACNEVDFSAIAHQAQGALTYQDEPTDLALYLDRTIHHLLIDEFQDTSIQQFELITQLIEGFQPDDGKTIFIVGDPMQSIYRFRSAEVGLFLQAQRHGIGAVRLTPLSLQSNFRATQTLVHWCNQQFKAIFPPQDDLESGAVCFHASSPVIADTDASFVQAIQCTTKIDEATHIRQLIQHELAEHPSEQIAILVRSRSQLAPIIQALRAHDIAYQGVHVDWISALPHIKDVWSMTQAFLMPSHRLAWLSFLHSPWCGLSLSDLHVIAQINPHQSIYQLLSHILANDEMTLKLSPDGQCRLRALYPRFQRAFLHRYQYQLIDWLLSILTSLHLDHILSLKEQDDLEPFWSLVEQHQHDGQLPDLPLFERALNQLYAQNSTPANVHIMTIHKAKGLEFDCVILPCLGSKTSPQDRPLLRWLTLPTTTSEPITLVSPIQAAQDDHCPLYHYLGKLDAEKDQYEQQRLLYVAITRAKKRLYLLDHHDKGARGTFRALLNSVIFTSITSTDTLLEQTKEQASLPTLTRLPHLFYQAHQTMPDALSPAFNALSWADSTPRIIGLIAHELLQWICTYHPLSIENIPWSIAHDALKQYGFDGPDAADVCQQLERFIHPLFSSQRGRWLIQAHQHERNEYELLVFDPHQSYTRIIDRLFHENGICWIIDFKTGGEDAASQAAHHDQLNEYAALLRPHMTLPIHCGLYYLSTHHWVEWIPATILGRTVLTSKMPSTCTVAQTRKST